MFLSVSLILLGTFLSARGQFLHQWHPCPSAVRAAQYPPPAQTQLPTRRTACLPRGVTPWFLNSLPTPCSMTSQLINQLLCPHGLCLLRTQTCLHFSHYCNTPNGVEQTKQPQPSLGWAHSWKQYPVVCPPSRHTPVRPIGRVAFSLVSHQHP